MRVAFIGNMNNNHFAMMRYFHDLGVEAHLFKFANELDHFQPESDTYFIEKWKFYIHQTDIIDGDIKQLYFLKKKNLYSLFKGYDFYIGNGLSPYYLAKAGIPLHLFLPYSIGIEYTYRIYKKTVLDVFKEFYIKCLQENAIKKNVSIICTTEELTIDKSISLGIRTERLSIPMVYFENIQNQNWPITDEIKNKILNFDFKIFSHVSHIDHENKIYKTKRNDILIISFAKYLKNNPNHNSVLILLEYGNDVEYTKKLIKENGIEFNVIWLPKMTRKDLMFIIDKIDIGASEFGGYTWGGTGWEFLCMGKLFFHYIHFNKSQIENIMSAPLPPFINSNDSEVISEKLSYYYNNKLELKELEKDIKLWFNSFSGKELAKKYIDLLKSI